MRLLQSNDDGSLSLTKFFEDDIPEYAILSHRWGAEEVTFRDLIDGTGKVNPGYGKIQFCGEQARRDGLKYFWVDTCCIDKSSSAELSEAINSIEWFTRGWTLPELIAPASVDFFCKDRVLLGNKFSLERHICEVTGIPASTLRGSPLSDFSVAERMSWAAGRETTCKEDKAYSLLGIFDVYMPLIYGEGKDRALTRLREGIVRASRKLVEIHKALGGDGSRRVVVLHGLGGIGKTQLSIAYAKQHKDNYSAIFWLNIEDEHSLKQSFTKLAKQISREHQSAIQVGNRDTNQNLDEVVKSVKAWLSLPSNTRWLMTYDNYDNPKLPGRTDPMAVDIRKFLPESYQGSIIITTRSSEVRIGHSIQIRKLVDVRDSLEILSTLSRREGLVTDPDAVKLAEELDGLPLALAEAGAYLG
ncbi:hypothetical protein MMC25_008305 [Agyrium rufum]|nr:hypothetical protein [Agyrium rufum]